MSERVRDMFVLHNLARAFESVDWNKLLENLKITSNHLQFIHGAKSKTVPK